MNHFASMHVMDAHSGWLRLKCWQGKIMLRIPWLFAALQNIPEIVNVASFTTLCVFICLQYNGKGVLNHRPGLGINATQFLLSSFTGIMLFYQNGLTEIWRRLTWMKHLVIMWQMTMIEFKSINQYIIILEYN